MSTEPKVEPEVAWSTADETEAGRDFEGTVIEAIYPYHNPESSIAGDQIRLMVRSDQYEKDQPIWIEPTTVKGGKWSHFRDALAACGVFREVKVPAEGTPTQKLQVLCAGLVGMKFHWQDKWFPRANNPKETVKICIPLKYLGKSDVSAAKAAVSSEKVNLG